MRVYRSTLAGLAITLAATSPLAAQAAPGVLPGVKAGGSPNIHVLGHIPLGGFFRVMDNEVEQDLNRPFVYLSQSRDRKGFSIVDIKDPEHPKKIYDWVIENEELHGGTGGMDGKYFKLRNKAGVVKYYYVQSLQFGNSGPDADLGAVVADVTGLPDTSKVKIVARIRFPETPGGFHNIFAYKHSDGRILLFATHGGPEALVYDMEKLLAGDPKQGLIGRVPIPSTGAGNVGLGGYHDFQVFYDVADRMDKFYGAGRGGYYVFNVTKPETPVLVASIVGASGLSNGHTFTPDPNGRVSITEAEYQFAPLRVFDLTDNLAGKTPTVRGVTGAWTADWQDLSHNHEVRWPYVFVSGYEDGLQVFNMADPKNPQTVGWYYTCMCEHNKGYGGPQAPNWTGTSVMQGAFGIKVRDADGLITISDSNTGFWLFKMDGYQGWKGEDWGFPNISSAQDWDNGPVPKPKVAQ